MIRDEKQKTEKPSEKFYTAFVIVMEDEITGNRKLLHCMHKYLGEQTMGDMRRVVKLCDEFFETNPVFPYCIFNEEDFFGVDKGSIRVLKSFVTANNFFPELRETLRHFREDDFPEYTPHITVNLPYQEIIGSFHCFAIMSGKDKIYKYYTNRRCPHVETKKENHATR